MNAISLNLPEEFSEKIEAIASARKMSVEEFYLEMTRSFLADYEAEQRFQERVERGKGREAEALALLRR